MDGRVATVGCPVGFRVLPGGGRRRPHEQKISRTQAARPDATPAGVGMRFVAELEAGKPTLRLEHILRELHALGSNLVVEGLPTAAEGTQHAEPIRRLPVQTPGGQPTIVSCGERLTRNF